ncbi:ArsR family transcriptional regulator [Actinomadura fulvescens]|uniref:HTH arsR-type domain-containing protein n=1 Tax=Actinomadura fulvescens TaxID=46160 RepID=A0ABN3QNB7_9ACTN
MIRRPARPAFGRPQRRSAGRGRFGGRRRDRYTDAEMFDPLYPAVIAHQVAPRHPVAGPLARAAARGYIRWMLASPDTRGLGTGLAALYPAGHLAHEYAAGDALLLGAFAPPAALAAWVATYKTHGSPRYSGAIAAIAAGIPAWFATAATTGITNLPTLLGYTLTATTAWSAYTWSDVLKERRRFAEAQAKWETIAGLAGLEGSRLLRTERTRTGVKFKIDLGVEGPSASRLERGDLAEQIARCYGIGADQVRIRTHRKNARIAWIIIQLVDLWSNIVPHPAVTAHDGTPVPAEAAAAGKGQRSILDGPYILGTDPETGDDLTLVVFDEGGARHVDIVGSNGGGKTNTLSNIVQQGAERSDVLTVAIDLGKGVIPTLWREHLHDYAGVGEEDKALAIFEWIDALLDERAIDLAGGTLVPSATSPVVQVIVDEQDTATGFHSAVAADIKPVLDKIHKRGRSLGVVLITAKQRDVVQHTGSKEGKANAYTTIVGRVANTKEMAKALPDWEVTGCPDMSTYGGDAQGVILLVRQGGTWQAGRTRALYDPKTVQALAAAYGPATAHLEPHIATDLPGYTDHHPTPTTTTATTRRTGNPDHRGGDHRRGGSEAPDGRSARPDGHDPDRQTHPDRTGSRDQGWGFDPADDAAVDEAAKGLVEQLDEFIAETLPPPEQATSLEDLKAARERIDNTTVPASVVQAVTDLLAERGTKGARRDELVKHLKMSRSTVAEHLGALRRDGIITSAGQGKAARYYLPDHAPDDHAT